MKIMRKKKREKKILLIYDENIRVVVNVTIFGFKARILNENKKKMISIEC